MNDHQFKSWLSILMLAICIVAIFYAFQHIGHIFSWLGTFFSVLTPFIAGFMISYVLNIPREGIEKLLSKVKYNFILKRKRAFSIALTYIVLILIIALLPILIFPHIISGINQFITFLPQLLYNIESFLFGIDDDIPFINIAQLLDGGISADFLENFNIENIGTAFGTLISSFVVAFRVFLALISSVYFLAEGEKLKKFIKKIFIVFVNKRILYGFIKYGRSINKHFKLYIKCQVLDALILGALATIVMTPLTQYAFALGPMMTVANLIPYFGSLLSTAFAIIVIMIERGFEIGILAAVILIILQQIDANYIFPRLLGGTMKISPLLVIISISIGSFYYGIIGMIIAIPIAAVSRNIIVDILNHYEYKKNSRRSQDYEGE